jgi:hypothetical protein
VVHFRRQSVGAALLLVLVAVARVGEGKAAEPARVRAIASVDAQVPLVIGAVADALAAGRADVGSVRVRRQGHHGRRRCAGTWRARGLRSAARAAVVLAAKFRASCGIGGRSRGGGRCRVIGEARAVAESPWRQRDDSVLQYCIWIRRRRRQRFGLEREQAAELQHGWQERVVARALARVSRLQCLEGTHEPRLGVQKNRCGGRQHIETKKEGRMGKSKGWSGHGVRVHQSGGPMRWMGRGGCAGIWRLLLRGRNHDQWSKIGGRQLSSNG